MTDISQQQQIAVKPGVMIDNSEPYKGRIWLTGTVTQIETVDTLLPANNNPSKENASYTLLQLTLTVPSTDPKRPFNIKAVTVEAIPLITSTDGVNFKGVPALEVEKALHIGQEVRLNVLNQQPEVFQNQWVQKNGSWNAHGLMMLYLLQSYREDTSRILNSPAGTNGDLFVVFDGILYNSTGTTK
ncbi:hypothetical protein BH10PAT2_BH10PAT2_2200 [soil metagenome]